MDKEKAKQEVRELIDKYNKVLEEKRISKYNEEMTKKDFILPLFRALGWKVEDSGEVSAEERISKGRVDYSFRINGIPKFFLEAKPLKEDLDNPKFIEQAINYAWHKGCTWAVLTDFESVRIFNAEWKISNPLQSRLKTIPCHEFLDRFSELWLLSKESFEQGLLDKEAEKWGKKTKKTLVDKQLLADFTRFRELLSKNIMKLNQRKYLTEEDLDESIQRILDRLIFIRNCEDRELEEKTLISNLREWESGGKGQLIKSLREVFAYFDKQYNSKIFITHLCDDLMISDEVLHEIIEGLYYIKDKSVFYDFSAIEADVLGNIYEQYLGHILKKSEKRAKLTANNAHRKEQGIYYTPTYIVDYIVRSTLGELLKNKKVNAENIKVLDPACGSGSFLIKAFDVLNEYYSRNDKDYNQTQIDFKTGTPFTTKAKILQNNIFGVDLDKQAVEIAQLNLLLKIAERGHRLPMLQQNIKCGNSLIDDSTIAGDKAFKWREEFKRIMNEGGFDVVVGNPPWGADIDEITKYLKRKYPNSTSEHKDIYKCFIEQAVNLLKLGGIFGFIVPSTCLLQPRYRDIRLFLKQFNILKIINLGEKVFEGVEAPSCILIIQKIKSDGKNKVKIVDLSNSKDNSYKTDTLSKPVYLELYQKIYDKTVDNNFVVFYREKEKDELYLQDIMDCKDCGIKYQRVGVGMKEKGKNDLHERLFYEGNQKNKNDQKYIIGADLKRYFINHPKRFMRNNFKKLLKPDEIVYFNQDCFSADKKILWRQTANRPICCICDKGRFANTLQAGILKREFENTIDLKYLLGILNSKYLAYLYIQSVKELGRVFPQVKLNKIKSLPIKIAPLVRQRPLIKLVDKILSLNKRLNEIGDKKTDERARIEDEIMKTDAQIDDLVYKIYGINAKEKKIVEESLK